MDGHCCFAGCRPCSQCGKCMNVRWFDGCDRCSIGGCTTIGIDAPQYRPGIDVVMVNYRTPDDADAFVGSFRESRITDSSLWVVNVSPTERDENVVEAALVDAPGEHALLTFTENIGYARACNIAASFGNREVVAFFNADTRLSPGLLAELLEQIREHPDWGIVGPRQVDDQNLIVAAGIYGTEANPSWEGRWKQVDRGQYNEVRDDCVTVSGSAYFVRRTAWDELSTCPIYLDHCPEAEGAFLPTSHYYEETWCSYHARAHGWKVVYYGLVRMVHRWHQASPVGGYAERVQPISQEMFRAACDAHGIDRD